MIYYGPTPTTVADGAFHLEVQGTRSGRYAEMAEGERCLALREEGGFMVLFGWESR